MFVSIETKVFIGCNDHSFASTVVLIYMTIYVDCIACSFVKIVLYTFEMGNLVLVI